MKDTFCNDRFSSRRNDLKAQLCAALDLNERTHFSSLEAQWVHRYGLDTLPTLFGDNCLVKNQNNVDVHDEKVDDSTFIPSEGDVKDQRKDLVVPSCNFDDSECSEEIDNSDPEELNDSSDEGIDYSRDITQILEASEILPAPPPPPPSLKHLRRWLPRIEDDLPEAS